MLPVIKSRFVERQETTETRIKEEREEARDTLLTDGRGQLSPCVLVVGGGARAGLVYRRGPPAGVTTVRAFHTAIISAAFLSFFLLNFPFLKHKKTLWPLSTAS